MRYPVNADAVFEEAENERCKGLMNDPGTVLPSAIS